MVMLEDCLIFPSESNRHILDDGTGCPGSPHRLGSFQYCTSQKVSQDPKGFFSGLCTNFYSPGDSIRDLFIPWLEVTSNP